MELENQFASLGEIAHRLVQPLHRVQYLVRSRQIKPLLVAGGRHFYSEAAVEQIASELRRIDDEKGGRQ